MPRKKTPVVETTIPLDERNSERLELIPVQTVKGVLRVGETAVSDKRVAFHNHGNQVTIVSLHGDGVVTFISRDGEHDITVEVDSNVDVRPIEVGPFPGFYFNQFDSTIRVDVKGSVAMAVKRVGI